MWNYKRHFYFETVKGEVRKKTYVAFVDLGEVFDRVSRDVVSSALRKLGVKEWLPKIVLSIYRNAPRRVRATGPFSEDYLRSQCFVL